jgi:hypothetical protein
MFALRRQRRDLANGLGQVKQSQVAAVATKKTRFDLDSRLRAFCGSQTSPNPHMTKPKVEKVKLQKPQAKTVERR